MKRLRQSEYAHHGLGYARHERLGAGVRTHSVRSACAHCLRRNVTGLVTARPPLETACRVRGWFPPRPESLSSRAALPLAAATGTVWHVEQATASSYRLARSTRLGGFGLKGSTCPGYRPATFMPGSFLGTRLGGRGPGEQRGLICGLNWGWSAPSKGGTCRGSRDRPPGQLHVVMIGILNVTTGSPRLGATSSAHTELNTWHKKRNRVAAAETRWLAQTFPSRFRSCIATVPQRFT